jgi:monooxygenase
MFSGVPNLVSTFGYINASWTLRADLTAEYFCRVLKHMDKTGYRQCTPRLGDAERNMPALDWITAFSSGYMQRAMHLLPKQGDREPWLNTQNYDQDKKMIRGEAIDDGVLSFSDPEQGSTVAGSRHFESNAA